MSKSSNLNNSIIVPTIEISGNSSKPDTIHVTASSSSIFHDHCYSIENSYFIPTSEFHSFCNGNTQSHKVSHVDILNNLIPKKTYQNIRNGETTLVIDSMHHDHCYSIYLNKTLINDSSPQHNEIDIECTQINNNSNDNNKNNTISNIISQENIQNVDVEVPNISINHDHIFIRTETNTLNGIAHVINNNNSPTIT